MPLPLLIALLLLASALGYLMGRRHGYRRGQRAGQVAAWRQIGAAYFGGRYVTGDPETGRKIHVPRIQIGRN